MGSQRIGSIVHPENRAEGVLNHGATALGNDRRGARRYRVSVRVEFAAADGSRRANVYNLGKDGIFICTAEPLALGAQMSITVHLPGEGDLVCADGQVVWTNLVETPSLPAGMGVRFTKIDPIAWLRLSRRLESLD